MPAGQVGSGKWLDEGVGKEGAANTGTSDSRPDRAPHADSSPTSPSNTPHTHDFGTMVRKNLSGVPPSSTYARKVQRGNVADARHLAAQVE